jgi:glutathione synthase/RimK-type ligase-like ATP-grasp enzyme
MGTPILLLTDYRDYFYSSTRAWDEGMRLDRICEALRASGFEPDVRQVADVDFRDGSFAGRHVVYQSAEDPELLYKSYLTDVLLGLALAGANLVPRFPLFYAHHNKSFMEILREVGGPDCIRTLRSRPFGTLEEFQARVSRLPGELVLKPAAGALSAGIVRARSHAEKLQAARHVSRSGTWYDHLKDVVKRRVREPRHWKSSYRRKFVAQEFLAGLQWDYKVLVYGEKYYVLQRRNRARDFRASGSGLFSWPTDVPPPLLEFSRQVFEAFDCPFVALDVAHDGSRYHLLEIQFLSFGNLTLEQSTFYWNGDGDRWRRVVEAPDLEREFAASVVRYIRSHEQAGRPFRAW